jgi:hypothetical protein
VSDIRTGKTEKCPGCGVTLYETQDEHTTSLLDAEGRYHHGPGGCANTKVYCDCEVCDNMTGVGCPNPATIRAMGNDYCQWCVPAPDGPEVAENRHVDHTQGPGFETDQLDPDDVGDANILRVNHILVDDGCRCFWNPNTGEEYYCHYCHDCFDEWYTEADRRQSERDKQEANENAPY